MSAGPPFGDVGDEPTHASAAAAPCGWCGLRISRHTVHATPTCTECKQGGKEFRVRMSLQRWKRGQK